MAPSNPVTRILSANIVIQALGLVTTLVTARLLDISGFGRLTAVLLWTAFIPQILNLSLPDTMITRSRNPSDIPQTYRNGFALTCALAFLSALILLGVEKTGILSLTSEEFIAATLLMGLTLVSACIASLEQRLANYGKYNRILVATSLISFFGLVPAIISPSLQTVSYVLWVRVAAYIAPVASRFFYRRRYLLGFPDAAAIDLLRVSLGFHVTATLNAVSTRADQLIATGLLSNAQMGILGLILPFGRATKSLSHAVSTVALVNVVEGTSSENKLNRIRQSRRAATIGGIVAAAACTAGASAVLLLQSSGQQHPSDPLLLLIVVALFYMTTNSVAGVVDLTIRLHRGIDVVAPGIISRVISTLGGVCMSWLAINTLGILGAGIAALGTAVLSILSLDISTMMYTRRRRS